MTDNDILKWIKDNLYPIIEQAIADSSSTYQPSLLAAMAWREAGVIIARNAPNGLNVNQIAEIAKGDYTQRPGETKKQYHGFSFWQIDIKSFPDFINSGDWKDPYKACRKAIAVLNQKRKYISNKIPSLANGALLKATISGYNTGEGNVVKSLRLDRDTDTTTAHGNYAKKVLEMKEQFENLV